jgi:hypothetical protein
MFVLAAGSAAAENEIPATCDPLMIVASASESVSDGSSWFFPASDYSRHRSDDTEQIAGTGNVIEPEGRCCDAITNTAFVGLEMENALIDDEGLGRVSGGAALFATPDVINQRVFAIKLWDEGKFRSSTPYKQVNGQIISTISVQGR